MLEIISIKNLSKSYNQTKAVNNLSLIIDRGEFFGFLGPNGAGKTTTIRMLTGIIKPTNGEITISGFTQDKKEDISRIIGVTPESRGFYDWMTAFEYLQFFANIYNIKNSEQSRIIASLLSQVGLLNNNVMGMRINAYSRGMKQRLGLARSLINKPEILFLDEPTLGLDPQGQEDIQNLLQKLNKEGVTIFLSSHLLHEVSNLCSKIAIIHKGNLVAEGAIDELRQKTGLKETYYVRIQGSITAVQKSDILSHIDKIKDNGVTSDFIFQDSLGNANKLLDTLREKNIQILEFRSESETLTDIFLNLTLEQ
jgi:ABC-type multidrug transport system ATPase subunit